jgi:hypothetical protein
MCPAGGRSKESLKRMLLQNAIADALNNTEWAFPLAECFHIPAFALSIGTIALVDLRLLGVALRGESPAKLLRDTEPWTLIGLVIVIFSGALLFLSQTQIYLVNSSFYFKIGCLLVAIVYNFTIHRKVASSTDVSPGVAKLVAIVSLALWVAVVFGGIFIAFV